ncbi:MAG: TetR family transcriptional regulator C-terminal domain-containing protein [Pseudomonadota bacterium]
MTTKKSAQSPKPRSRSAREKPETRKRLLVEATIRCLGRGGLSAFTIDQICREAKVARGLINHYYKSKDDLLISVYETMTQYMAQATQELAEDTSLSREERITRIIEANFDAQAFDPATLRAWLALWGEIPTNPDLKKFQQDRYLAFRDCMAQTFEDLARERGRDVNGTNLAMKLIAFFDGLWIQWCIEPNSITPEKAKAACFELIETELGSIAHTVNRRPT